MINKFNLINKYQVLSNTPEDLDFSSEHEGSKDLTKLYNRPRLSHNSGRTSQSQTKAKTLDLNLKPHKLYESGNINLYADSHGREMASFF